MFKALCLASLSLTLFIATESLTAAEEKRNDKSDKYLINFKQTPDLKLLEETQGVSDIDAYSEISVVSANLTPEALKSLTNNTLIETIEIDATISIIPFQSISSNTLLSDAETTAEQMIPWGVADIGADKAHMQGITGKGVKIGILDSGIDYKHKDLRISGGISFVDGKSDYMDDNGHGTFVTGIIASLNNNYGLIGVAPDADIYAIKVVNFLGNGSYSSLIKGIEWAVKQDLDVINISLEGTEESKALRKAVDHAIKNGTMVVASSGNSGYNSKGNVAYPAAYEKAFAVGATDQEHQLASFSNVGKQLDIVAPGQDIISIFADDYVTSGGTSMATAHVTGSIALMRSMFPEMKDKEIEKYVEKSALRLGDTFKYGRGLIQVDKALELASRHK
ncbi:hypothetical protein BC351_13250 [Paenibacillus ferrarius]|uniref:Peptidase S8/S53 domain-containing protein n=1 Tax=Paenibacillus ferrarius TaxID=1469647 RepID=A0A1V4H725_9BACL|nr:hypothetical protein BC351_13250 [Paenibacillus ferrarius]